MENANKEKKCDMCQVSEDTIESLKKGKEGYLAKKQEKEGAQLRVALNKKIKKVATVSLLSLLLVGGAALFAINYSQREIKPVPERQKITVFYSPTCSCCSQYISYLKGNGFDVLTETDASKRMDILEKYQLPQEMMACHTSLVGDYFVEGHMPAEVIKKLLEEKPEIDGIALPGMPQGAPGMSGFKVGKWTIYGFSKGAPSEFMVY